MIVYVAEGRRDRKSSFKVLTKYVSEGIDEQGLEGAFAAQHGFDDITSYVVADAESADRKATVEKTLAVEVGNLTSLRTASTEMAATAARCKVVDDPVIHYILSWKEGERPGNDKIFDAAKHTLKAIGLDQHQYVLAIHGNTDNIHCHVVVNKINPDTFRSKHLEWLHKTLHRAAREAEIKHGWSHDPGLFSVHVSQDGTKSVVETSKLRPPLQGDNIPINPKAAKYELWHGQVSLDRWCKEVAGPKLIEVIQDNPTWPALHQALADYGLSMEYAGGGSYRIVAKDSDGKPIASIAASKAIRQLSGAAIEAKLGKYSPPSAKLVAAPVRTYKRDPQARLDRRIERQALRDDLHARFLAHVGQVKNDLATVYRPAKAQVMADFTKQRDALFQRQKSMRESVRLQTSLPNKQAHYSIIRMMAIRERELLASAKKAAVEQLAVHTPTVPSWREYVQAQASLGDAAAINALRGLTYQDKRDAKKGLPIGAVDEDEKRPTLVAPPAHQLDDPKVQVLKNLKWEVGTTGAVTYRVKNGQKLFVDDGNRLNFEKATVSDGELAVVLRYAKDKWRGQIRINGGDSVFRARLLKQAAVLGVQVLAVEEKHHKQHAVAKPKLGKTR